MTPGQALFLTVAGIVAGVVNAVVGSGTLITYPALLAIGLNPVLANGTNTAGLFLGNLAGFIGYRRMLVGAGRQLLTMVSAAFVGGLGGALLVLVLPEDVFATVVPVLIIAAVVLVALQPLLTRSLRRRALEPHLHRRANALLLGGVFATGIYGGYFGAAQGIVSMAVLCLLFDPDVQRSNGAKNLLTGGANLAAALVFALGGSIAWLPALMIAIGAITGGLIGARLAQRLPPWGLRGVVIATGIWAAVTVVVGL